MRLDIRMLRPEYLLGPIYCRLFNDIYEFAAAVIPFSWIAFGVLVRQGRAHRLQDRFGDKILRRDQFKPVMLTPHLVIDCPADQSISLRKILCKEGVHCRILYPQTRMFRNLQKIKLIFWICPDSP